MTPAGVSESVSAPRRTNSTIVLSVLFLVMHLPFLFRPYHIDDWSYVVVARHIQEQPLDPYGMTHVNAGYEWSMYEGMTRPPGWAYLLALAFTVRPESAATMHAAVFVLSAVAILAMFGLARELGLPAAAAGALLLTSPTYLLMAHSGMADVPMLACILLTMWAFVAAARHGSRVAAWGAAVSGSIAVLCGYQALILIPVLALWALIRRRRDLLLIALSPAITTLAWVVWAYGRADRLSVLDLSRPTALWGVVITERLVYALAVTGLALAPALVVVLMLRAGSSRVAVVAVSGLAGILLAFVATAEGSAMLAVSVALGVAAIFHVVHSLLTWARREREVVCLGLWVVLGFLAVVVVMPFGSARYLLVVLPPLILGGLWALGQGEANGRRIWVAVVINAVVALGVGIVDARVAAANHKGAAAVEPPEAHKLFVAGSFEILFWLEEAGYPQLLVGDERLAVGDAIVVSVNAFDIKHYFPEAPLAGGYWLQLEAIEPIAASLPLQINNHLAGAGFYYSGSGLLPFRFGWQDWDRLQRYRVGRALPLMADLDGWEVATPDAENVRRDTWLLDDGGHAALFAHPPTVMAREIESDGTRVRLLAGSAAMSPLAPGPPAGDGVDFSIWTVTTDGVATEAYRSHLSKPGATDGFSVSLASNVTRIELRTSPGRLSDASYDWAAWLDLDLREMPEPRR